MAVRTDHELQEPLLEIEGGPQSPELVSASIHADDEVPLEGSHRESRESQTAEFSAQASDEADVLQAGGEDGGDVVAASSYSEQSVTPEPSRLSATRSGAAVRAFSCLHCELKVLILFIAEVVHEDTWTQGWRDCILRQHNYTQIP